ncbi:MAG: DUF2839 domain-containing protein [Pseudanabaenales cyanobacterium]|nr:DUF2839 domain-containing protein [Pseudanabaenales cyanobacterium]
MGESKRRQELLGEQYGKESPIFPWLPITKSQLLTFYRWANRGAWIGIIVALVSWFTIRFLGPWLGLWEVV